MKLAEVDPLIKGEIENYASKHNYQIFEIVCEDEFPRLLVAVYKCISVATERGCSEIAIRSIETRYNFMMDINKWIVKVVGFK